MKTLYSYYISKNEVWVDHSNTFTHFVERNFYMHLCMHIAQLNV